MKHYLQSTNEVLSAVASSKDGLSGAEAEKRLEQNGKNKLVEGKKESLLHRFLKQLAEPMTIILIVAAAISAGVEIYNGVSQGHWEFPADVVIILAVVPVPHKKCCVRISLFCSHHSIRSAFLLSCAISAIFFFLPMVSVM